MVWITAAAKSQSKGVNRSRPGASAPRAGEGPPDAGFNGAIRPDRSPSGLLCARAPSSKLRFTYAYSSIWRRNGRETAKSGRRPPQEPMISMLEPRTRLALLVFARRQARRLPAKWDRRLRELAKLTLNYRGARAGALRALRFSRLGRHSRLLVAPFGKAELLVSAGDGEVGREVFIRGGYERIFMQAALSYLEAAGHACTGKAFVDVGANIGTSTVDALVHFGFSRAFCFEPDSRTFKLLELNLLLNDLAGRAAAFPLAISAEDGPAILERSATNFGDSRVSIPRSAGDVPGQEGAVECRSLDSLLEDGSISLGDVGLLWIDTQGHDALVLQGAAAVREAGIPAVIEYCPDALEGNRSLELLEQIVAASYTTVIDLRLLCHGLEVEAVTRAEDLALLRARYPAPYHTDLLLIP